MADESDGIMDGINSAIGTKPAPSKNDYVSDGRYDSMYADAGNKYGVDPALIKAVAITESKEQPNAISRDAQKNPIAHGLMQFTPATAKSMGMTNPYDPAQSIDSGARLLKQNLNASKGDTKNALMMYHGGTDQTNWGPKTHAYPNTVMSHMPQQEQSQDDDSDGLMAGINAAMKMPASATPTPAKVAPKALAPSTVQSQASDNRSDFLKGTASLLDNAYNIIPSAGGVLTYALERAMGKSPQDSTSASKTLTDTLNNPIGKAFGIDKDAAYANEGSRQIMNKVGETVSPILNKVKNYVADKTGIDASDIGNIGQSASFALPKVISGASEVASKLNRYRDAPLPEIYNNPTGKGGVITPQKQAPTAVAEQPMQGAGAATVNHNSNPKLTGEEDVRGNFPVVKLSTISQDVPSKEQALRSHYINEVMGDKNSVRTGVITGNENTLRNEHTEASAANPSPTGQVLKTQMANEQKALSDYAEKRVEATGADPRLISDETRGHAVNSAFFDKDSSLNKYFKDSKDAIYNYAKKTVGDNPIESKHIDEYMNDPQMQSSAEMDGTLALVNGANKSINLAKNVGFKDKITGEIHPAGSISAYDAVRKSINAKWTPEKASTIAEINGAIDKDIASAGGEELYKLGDKVHQSEKTIMGSSGIKSIFGPDDENGITKGVSHGKILEKLNNMPLDQWSHIHNVLDNLSNGRIANAPEGMPEVPQELMQSAKNAKAEIEGSLAREVHSSGGSNAGVWNQNSTNKTLNSIIGEKILKTFPPEEIKNFHTLNYAGQIMPGKHSYEGSAQQFKRMGDKGLLERFGPVIAAELGSKLLVPGATAAATYLGGKLSKSQEAKRLQELSTQMTSQMKKNADLKNKH